MSLLQYVDFEEPVVRKVKWLDSADQKVLALDSAGRKVLALDSAGRKVLALGFAGVQTLADLDFGAEQKILQTVRDSIDLIDRKGTDSAELVDRREKESAELIGQKATKLRSRLFVCFAQTSGFAEALECFHLPKDWLSRYSRHLRKCLCLAFDRKGVGFEFAPVGYFQIRTRLLSAD